MSVLEKSDINQVYNDNVDKIYRFFYFKMQDNTIVEDLTSKTFLEFVKKVKGKSDLEDPVKYLFGIAKIVFLQHLRRKYIDKRFINMEVGDFGTYVDQFIEEVEDHPTIEEFALPYIDQLPVKQQVVARMRFIEKMGLSEICEKLKKDMNYVKTTQKRAIKSLKKLVACTP